MWILWFAVLLPGIVSGQTQSCAEGSVGTVNVTAVTAFTATVQWGAGADPDCNLLYSVCWTLTGSGNTQCLSAPANATSSTVGELVPCNNYTIEVTGTDVTSNSSERGAVTARTIPRSLFFLNVTEGGPGEARLFWLYLFLGNECADQFLVAWSDETGLSTGSAYAPTSTNEYAITNLASCTNYTFSVSTLDSDLRHSEPLDVGLKTDMLSGVLSLSATDVGSSAFDMVWTRPQDSPSSACEHWFQPCWGAVDGGELCVLLSSGLTTARVESSGPCTAHNISVSTVSERARHTPFWIIHVTSSENDTVISAVHVVSGTQEWAYLSWVPVYEGLPCAMAYRLCWRREGDNSSCVLLHTDVTAHNVTGLRPGSSYAVQLAALFDTDDFSEAFNLTVTTGSSSGAGATAEKISTLTLAVCLFSFIFWIPNSH